ncbi:FG-GAP and VCBS repeat-containing protein [Streptomyces sp. SCSIO ZS0520]|uniref:FG-GAP and VCBS repeat-containing protein n=1 Tax=Streptomyces sp. SCSIO ZS0520 TaxID=2892996 RepID=UPI0021D93E57|nr:FG-GAP and VCBS repeat-containing protein [Streptomyces sp. SCSIO ZS0520]
MVRGRITAAAVAALVVAGALGGGTASAAAAPPPGDVDGDGYADLAVGAPDGTIAGQAEAGYVSLTYGTADGIRVSRKKGLTQNTAGVPGVPEAGDAFGSTVAVGDLDGDGHGDLVVGARGEAIGKVRGAGSVTVVFGDATGLSTDAIAFHAPTPVTSRGFGSELAVGDFDKDGRADLAVADGEKVRVVRGAKNLRDTPAPRLTSLTPPGGGAGIGSLTTGDVNGDGYADLVTTAYFDDPADEGTLGVLPGTAGGLSAKPLGKSVGLPFAGYVPVAGDIDGDGRDDVVVDTSFEDGPEDFKLRTFPGTAEGLGAGTPYGGAPVPGRAALLADTDGDSYADLVVADPQAPDEDGYNNAGSLTVVPGAAGGLSPDGARELNLDTPGVVGARENNNLFGAAVSAADFDADGRADLAVGAPNKYLGTGAVSILPAAAGEGSLLVNPESFDHPAAKARFGAAVSVAAGG